MEENSLFLSHSELKDYTGYSQYKKQITHLSVVGIPFEVAKGNRPVVLRETIQKRLSEKKERATKAKAKPMFEYINKKEEE